ncbi:HipA family kinase [Nocardioides sp. R-C-SC26]|uniref:HipA family kinase n=1 Tax=Nocardioides sp. R-C-SC26 TaxID=2870414 RepID=UPI001E579A1F|nr:HipA family kinase [Nocardioides sp. R-C-SC26]
MREPLAQVAVTRYLTPLREGGSMPGVVEGDDWGTYVCKFRGAGQGLRVLVAEVIAAGVASAVGLDTPRQVVLDLDQALTRFEADEEVQDLLRASVGTNLGIDFLPGSFGPEAAGEISAELASRIVWLDAFIANVDRSWRNPNLLWWGKRLWVIDHGASLYFHHGWSNGVGDPARFAAQPWSVGDHLFRDRATELAAVDAEVTSILTEDLLGDIVATVPADWLEPVPGTVGPEDVRSAYREFLTARAATRQWLPGGDPR